MGLPFIFMQQGWPLLCRRPTAAAGRREPSHGVSAVRARIASPARSTKNEWGWRSLVEQYLDFAEGLADLYAIMAEGAVVALGNPGDLKVEALRHYLTV